MSEYFAYIGVGLLVEKENKTIDFHIFPLVGDVTPCEKEVREKVEKEIPNIPIIILQMYPLLPIEETSLQIRNFLVENEIPESLHEKLIEQLWMALVERIKHS